MTCLGQTGQSFAQVHRLVQIDSGALAEVAKMVRFSASSAGPCIFYSFALGLGFGSRWLGGIGTQWLNILDSCRCIVFATTKQI